MTYAAKNEIDLVSFYDFFCKNMLFPPPLIVYIQIVYSVPATVSFFSLSLSKKNNCVIDLDYHSFHHTFLQMAKRREKNSSRLLNFMYR